jgi:hypothetical protein
MGQTSALTLSCSTALQEIPWPLAARSLRIDRALNPGTGNHAGPSAQRDRHAHVLLLRCEAGVRPRPSRLRVQGASRPVVFPGPRLARRCFCIPGSLLRHSAFIIHPSPTPPMPTALSPPALGRGGMRGATQGIHPKISPTLKRLRHTERRTTTAARKGQAVQQPLAFRRSRKV